MFIIIASLAEMLHAVTILGYVVTALALFIGWRYMEYRRRIRAVKATSVPVVAQFVDYLHLLAPILRLKYTRDFWRIAPETFTALNTPILAMVSSTSTSYHISEAALFKEVCVTRRRSFPKAIHLYDALRIFGDNVVTTNDHVWRRHRAAATQAFSDANNRLVLDTTIVMTTRMMSMWEQRTDPGVTSVRVLEEITRLTLAIITRAAFGMSLEDTEQGISASRHGVKYKLPFSTCMELVSMHTLPRLLLPRWAFHIPFFNLPQIGTAFKEFDCYLLDVIDAKRHEMMRAATATNDTTTTTTTTTKISSTTTTATTAPFEGAGSEDDDNTSSGSGAVPRGKGSDKGQSLLSLLIEAASDAHDPSKRLEEKELLGNAFIFLLAGVVCVRNWSHTDLRRLGQARVLPRSHERGLASLPACRSDSQDGGTHHRHRRSRWHEVHGPGRLQRKSSRLVPPPQPCALQAAPLIPA